MGKPSVPAAPDYTPFIQASQQTAAADSHAADLQFQLGEDTLKKQDAYAQRSADVGDKYYQMAQDSAQWGRDQFNTVWPYAQDYLKQETGVATEQNKEAADTYARYMSTYAPREDQFAREAFGWGSQARQDEAAGAAKADVASAFQQTQDAAKRSLMSYGVDPSQGRFAALADVGNYQQAAASAAAGTTARTQAELQGKSLEETALQIGQKLPALGLGQLQAGSGAGAAGLGGANQAIGTGVQSGGSPTAYAGLSNPYTQLAGSYGTVGGSLFGGGTSALGNISSAISAGAGAMNSGFSNQMSAYNAKYAQQSDLWGGIGKIVGMGAGFAMSDRRLKEDTKVVGHVGALPLHTFRYRDDPAHALHVGFMADEVEQVDPGAVHTVALPFKAVDYNRAVASALRL
jgi:hypothetical protein